MREIKFRAWDKEEDCIWEFDLKSVADGYITGSGKRFDECEVMQFTGLKDKNGKEIYEGDVLQKQSTDGNRHVFERFACEWSDSMAQYSVSGLITEKFEVIGNIYENPELLT